MSRALRERRTRVAEQREKRTLFLRISHSQEESLVRFQRFPNVWGSPDRGGGSEGVEGAGHWEGPRPALGALLAHNLPGPGHAWQESRCLLIDRKINGVNEKRGQMMGAEGTNAMVRGRRGKGCGFRPLVIFGDPSLVPNAPQPEISGPDGGWPDLGDACGESENFQRGFLLQTSRLCLRGRRLLLEH